MKRYGVGEKVWDMLHATCASFPQVKQAILYGSRARGDFHEGSDIDIAIDGPNMTSSEFAKIWNAIDDLPIIYTLDIIHLQSTTNPSLLSAIKSDGITIYSRASNR